MVKRDKLLAMSGKEFIHHIGEVPPSFAPRRPLTKAERNTLLEIAAGNRVAIDQFIAARDKTALTNHL